MAKIVSSKFGDRGLVHLPPVSFTGRATPQVQTLAPQYRGNPGNDDRGGYAGDARVLPKEYAYASPGGRDTRNVWMGSPVKGYSQGNIVPAETYSGGENGIGNHMFNQLVQQPNAMQGYPNASPGYPAGPGVSGSQQLMHYTPHALSSMAPARQSAAGTQQVPGQIPQGPGGQPPPQQPAYHGPANAPFQSGPNEKHIFYGPNGEILPGPPPGFQQGGRGLRTEPKLHDFTVEGKLRFGLLRDVKLVDPMQRFPVFPEYLLNDLKRKYGTYETTWVRIISRGGELHVHATPSVPGSQIMGPQQQAQYVPVYIDEDEYFGDNHTGYGPGPLRSYGAPPPWAHRDRDYNVPRPPTEEDPISELRWRLDDDVVQRRGTVRPVERSRSNFHR